MRSVYVLLVLISFTFQLSFAASGNTDSLESVPDLKKSMYKTVDGFPCVRLLNLSGEIGCANPGHEKIVAPVVRFGTLHELVQPSTVLVSLNEMQSLFSRISNDQSFAEKVRGILVESSSNISNQVEGFSPVEKFPEAKFAPYQNHNYEWNPVVSLRINKKLNVLQEGLILSDKNGLTSLEEDEHRILLLSLGLFRSWTTKHL